jgi:hypothetical protein
MVECGERSRLCTWGTEADGSGGCLACSTSSKRIMKSQLFAVGFDLAYQRLQQGNP